MARAPRPSRRAPVSSARAQLTTYADEHDLVLMFFEPAGVFDPAIVGVVEGYGQAPAVLYDEAAVLAGFVREGMTEEEAQEWFEFNTIGAFLGPETPRFLIQAVRPMPKGRPRPRA